MKIFLLTPGTGSYHCGVCIRDNALAKELHRKGHDAVMLPMYLPLTLDETAASPDTPIFFGGINVFLQQKIPLFRHTPRWLDSIFNNRWLLKKVAGARRARPAARILEILHTRCCSAKTGSKGRSWTS
jgi:hypothetical protein